MTNVKKLFLLHFVVNFNSQREFHHKSVLSLSWPPLESAKDGHWTHEKCVQIKCVHMTQHNWTVEKLQCTCKPCLLWTQISQSCKTGGYLTSCSRHLFNHASKMTAKWCWPRLGLGVAAGGRRGPRIGLKHDVKYPPVSQDWLIRVHNRHGLHVHCQNAR